MELLKQYPIAHDVLDVVRHHREDRVDKEVPEAAMVQRGKCELLAGLWDSWRKPDGKKVESFTIITTEPNDLIEPIHLIPKT